jgi:hypothetical protein
MSTTTQTLAPQFTKTALLGTSRYGNPMPRIDLRAPRGTSHRAFAAELHELAAKVERATPEAEGWCVTIERLGDTEGAVSLELADATAEEAARGMELLKGLVG